MLMSAIMWFVRHFQTS